MAGNILNEAQKLEHLILDESKLFAEDIKKGALYAEKKAIAAGITNSSGRDLTFDVVMKDGHNEARAMILPAGETAVIQANGEINLPLKKGTPIFGKLYDVEAKFGSAQEAKAVAQERRVTFTDQEAVDRALQHLTEKNPGLQSNELNIGYYPALGKLEMKRLPEELGEVHLPKTSWGSVQHNTGGDVIAHNPISQEYYMVDRRDGTLESFVDPKKPGQTTQELYDSIPVADISSLRKAQADIPAEITGAGQKPPNEIAEAVLNAQKQAGR